LCLSIISKEAVQKHRSIHQNKKKKNRRDNEYKSNKSNLVERGLNPLLNTHKKRKKKKRKMKQGY